MIPAFGFHGIAGCVTHLYGSKKWQQGGGGRVQEGNEAKRQRESKC